LISSQSEALFGGILDYLAVLPEWAIEYSQTNLLKDLNLDFFLEIFKSSKISYFK
jgi:hypothetical protein